jgi:hypothetical protein
MAPTHYLSTPPTKPLDLCITDTIYGYKAGMTVHKKCFDLVAPHVDMTVHEEEEKDDDDRSPIIGQACITVIDQENVQLEVRRHGEWDLQEAFAWTGESLDDVPRLKESEQLDLDAFPNLREWQEGQGQEWITTMPLLNADKHCEHGMGEFYQVMVLQTLVAGLIGVHPNNETEYFPAWPKEHYQQTGDFYWLHLGKLAPSKSKEVVCLLNWSFPSLEVMIAPILYVTSSNLRHPLGYSCHCDRTVEEEPPPTDAPTSAPSLSLTNSPTQSPTEAPSKIPTTSAPTMEDFADSGIGRCVGSEDGSGRECHPLIGDNKQSFGEVCIELVQSNEDTDDILNVTFTTTGEYRLTRNYLWIGEASSRVPVLHRELDQPIPNLDLFPHFSW